MVNKILIFLLLPVFSFANISKEDFLERVEKGTLQLNKNIIMPMEESVRAEAIGMFSQKYPSFKPAFLYYHSYQSMTHLYTVMYIWPNRRCVFRKSEIDPKTKKEKLSTIDINGQDIDYKYCEKLYGVPVP